MGAGRAEWMVLAVFAGLAAVPAGAADQSIITGSVSFISPDRTINVGDKVTWTNSAHGFHNVVSTDAGFRCAVGCDGEGGSGAASTAEWSFTRTFNSAGTFVYWCEIHGTAASGMRGTITVQGGGAAPSAPSNLKASALSKTQVQLTWKDNASNETGFVIEAQTGTGGGAFTQVGTAGANAQAATVGSLTEATFYSFRVRATNGGVASANSNVASATTDTDAAACADDDDTLCLSGDRFKIEVTWERSNPTQSGIGHRVELTPDTGYFWFFASTNVEMVIKVLNACGLNSRYWVFAGGLTNVKAVITVTDSQTGKIVTYVNPPNTTFQPIQDTGAFATCP